MNKTLSLLLLLSLTSCSKIAAAQPTFAVVIAQGITLCVILLLSRPKKKNRIVTSSSPTTNTYNEIYFNSQRTALPDPNARCLRHQRSIQEQKLYCGDPVQVYAILSAESSCLENQVQVARPTSAGVPA